MYGQVYHDKAKLNYAKRGSKSKKVEKNQGFSGQKSAPQSGAKTGLWDKDMSRFLPQKEHLDKL